MARIVLDYRRVVSLDIDQQEEIENSHYTMDNTELEDAVVAIVKPPAAGVVYQQIPFPPGWTRIGYLSVETDAPISIRLNTVDGTSGTEIPLSPVITPALSQTNFAPAPNATASVQKGRLEIGSGGSQSGNPISLTSLWVKNPGVTAATIKVVMVGE